MNYHHPPLVILLVVLPLMSAVFIPLLGLVNKRFVYPFLLTVLGLVFAIAVKLAWIVTTSGPQQYFLGGWSPPWGIEYYFDTLSSFMAIIISFIALMVAVFSNKSVAREVPGREVPFYAVFLLLVTGLLGIVSTGDMFNLYVFLEISSISGYALIAMGSRQASFSAFKYIIVGTIGACFYLLGTGYLYMVTGTLNMADLARILPPLYSSKAVLVAFAFFIIGVTIKMGLFPMHNWLPDAYTHAPSAISALIAPTMTKVSAFILIRIMFLVFEPDFYTEIIPATAILSWMGVVAMIAGSVFAITQTDFKRMLAYSSIAQIGYIVLGIGLANHDGLTGGILHILNHAFMKGCLFMIAGAIIYKRKTQIIGEFKNLYIKMPFTMAAFIIASFSMIGIPPTAGFFSKLYLITGSIEAGNPVFVAAILLSSVLNLVYFINVIKMSFFKPETPMSSRDEGQPEIIKRDEAPISMLVPIGVLAAGIIILGLINGWIINIFIKPIITAAF